eukprot:scaffold2431_cov116-Isochrysis_galbana.AAC.3
MAFARGLFRLARGNGCRWPRQRCWLLEARGRVFEAWRAGWRRVEAAATPRAPAWTSGCRWEPGDGIGARFDIPAGAWRRWPIATWALLEARGRVFEAW